MTEIKRKDFPESYIREEHDVGSMPFTKEQVQKIFDYYEMRIKKSASPNIKFVNLRNLTIIKMLVYMGNRPREVWASLKIDLDINDKTFFIRAENNKTKRGAIQKIPSILLDDLKFYINELDKKYPDTKYLFPSVRNPNKLMDRADLDNSFRLCLKFCGYIKTNFIDGKGVKRNLYNLYSLRKSYASFVYNEIHDTLLISKLLRHKDVRTAPRHYIRLMDGVCEKAVEQTFSGKNENQKNTINGVDTELKSLILDFIDEQRMINKILLSKEPIIEKKVSKHGVVFLGTGLSGKKIKLKILSSEEEKK